MGKDSISNRQSQRTANPNPRVKIGGRTHLGLGAPLTAGYRRAGKSCAAAHRGAAKNRAAARRRDAGAHASELQSEALSTASSMAARSPTGERAHRRASRDDAASSSPPRPPWPSPPLRGCRCVAWREKGEGERVARVSGNTGVVGFDPANRAGDRPIKIDGRDRASPPGLAGGPCGRGRGRRGGPIRRPGHWLSGLGPKERWPSRPRAGLLLCRLNSV